MHPDSRPPSRSAAARRAAAAGQPAGADWPAGADVACALGIDLGTSSAKAVVIDTAGVLLSQASARYPVVSAAPGYAESEPGRWWAAITACVREAVAAAGARPAAIGLSGQMHGLVMTSATHEALRPALLWADSRASGCLRAYRALDSRARARLANPLAPGMAGPLLCWIAANEPRTYAAARWALQPKDWVRARLTGDVYAEPSDASATLLYDLIGDSWDLEVAGALGLDARLLAPLLPSAGALAGQLLPAAAAELGLPAGLPVAAGAGDTAAAALGGGVVNSDDVQLTIGTGAQVIRPVSAPAGRADAGIHLYRSAAPVGWYHLGATTSAGLSLGWVREIMNASWEELYASAQQPAGRHDPVFVPHLAGERTPYFDPGLRGSWTGLSLANDRTAVLRSALEGVAFSIREALEALLGDHRPPRLRLAGGGTLDAGWRQLLADVLGLPLHAVHVPAASGRGAALLGASAAGLLSLADIQGPLAPPASLVAEPDPAMTAFYAERYPRFRAIARALRAPGLPEAPDPSVAPDPSDERPAGDAGGKGRTA